MNGTFLFSKLRDRAIRYSGFFGVREVQWVRPLEISWIHARKHNLRYQQIMDQRGPQCLLTWRHKKLDTFTHIELDLKPSIDFAWGFLEAHPESWGDDRMVGDVVLMDQDMDGNPTIVGVETDAWGELWCLLGLLKSWGPEKWWWIMVDMVGWGPEDLYLSCWGPKRVIFRGKGDVSCESWKFLVIWVHRSLWRYWTWMRMFRNLYFFYCLFLGSKRVQWCSVRNPGKIQKILTKSWTWTFIPYDWSIEYTAKLSGAWKGAIWSWGYLKPLHNTENTELPPGFYQHIWATFYLTHLRWSPYSLNAPLSWSCDFTCGPH